MQAAGVHVGWAKTDVREGSCSGAEQAGDVMAGDMVLAGAHKVDAKGCHWRKARGAEVLNSANEGLGGAHHGVPAAAVSDDLATFPVLLGVKCKGTVGGTVQVRWGRGEQCKAGGTYEGDIRQHEWGILRGLAMLTGPEKIEISNPGHVDGGLGLGRRATNGLCSVYDLDR